jgi:hypothetical protein
MILLCRWQAKYHQHPFAHYWLDGSAIPLRLLLGQIVERLDLLVDGVEVPPRTQLGSWAQGTAQYRYELPLPSCQEEPNVPCGCLLGYLRRVGLSPFHIRETGLTPGTRKWFRVLLHGCHKAIPIAMERLNQAVRLRGVLKRPTHRPDGAL